MKTELDTIKIDMASAKLFAKNSPMPSITYAPLQTDNAPLIGKIRLVKFPERKIYILVREGEKCTILMCNSDGSLVGKIEHPGEGPGELSAVNDFNIKYGLDLSFIDEIKIDNIYKEFVKFEKDRYAFYAGNKDIDFKNLVYNEYVQ